MSTSFLGLFGAGLLTFLSPCVLPLIPILLASLLVGDSTARQRLLSASWFVGGFTLVFVLMGLSIPSLTGVLG
ncbi:MAG TPA: hypothetical protein DCS07_09335 [Bdellovibrionales bacterium]|nr:hypothetical protein [Bdellovibrionales bacterium]